jgi:hypothetical protein
MSSQVLTQQKKKKKKEKEKEKTKQDFDIDTTKPTPKLDAVKNRVNKLLSATAATYIPESSEALRQDWFPTMSGEVMKKNPAVQEAIKEKILDTYAVERTQDGVWKESYIGLYWTDWLKNPTIVETGSRNLEKAREAKSLRKFLTIAEEQKKTFDKVANSLPEAPKPTVEEPEEETQAIGEGTIYVPEKERLPTPIESYELGVRAIEKLWESLTNVDHTPGAKEDVFNEYIKPSDKFRLRLWKGLDEARAIHYHDLLVWTETVVKRALDTWDEIQREKK